MAKIKYPDVNKVIYEHIQYGVDRNSLHLNAKKLGGGRLISIDGEPLINFGSCSYLCLDDHPKVLEAAIQGIKKEGIHFPSSRGYVSSTLYEAVEHRLAKIFESPVILFPSTTLAHLAGIPALVGANDLVVLDQQVHASVRQAVQVIKPRGVSVTTLRHNQLKNLETILETKGKRHHRVWLMLDGIYSMFGDAPDYELLDELMQKYNNLYLYIDDAHGMSWYGDKGKGYCLSKIKHYPNMVIATSLSKGFGLSGGTLIFSNAIQYQMVKNCGSSFMFSGPLTSGVLNACKVVADMHLTGEIKAQQNYLQQLIQDANQLLIDARLPIVAISETPIFFIATGTPIATVAFQRQLHAEGVYVNVSGFPVVPAKCGGVRFCLTSGHSLEDVEILVNVMEKVLPKTLQKTGVSFEKLAQNFKKPEWKELDSHFALTKMKASNDLTLIHVKSIHQIDPIIWDALFSDQGIFDWKGLAFIESIFGEKASSKEDQWIFDYFLIQDKTGRVILATFFTSCLWKDDLLYNANISKKLEAIREKNPYFLTSLTMSMGCMITEGAHLFLDRLHPLTGKAVDLFWDKVKKVQLKNKADQVVLRDFDKRDIEVQKWMMAKGFVRLDLPDAHEMEALNWEASQDYIASLSKNSRFHVRKQIKRYESLFEMTLVEKADEQLLSHFYQLYLNVKKNNYSMNTFQLPATFFQKAVENKDWEVFSFKVRSADGGGFVNPLPVAVVYAYRSSNTYTPLLIGMDYNYLKSHQVYRQVLFQMIMRARALNVKKLFLGMSATVEKKKLGATAMPRCAYIHTLDNYKQYLLEDMNLLYAGSDKS